MASLTLCYMVLIMIISTDGIGLTPDEIDELRFAMINKMDNFGNRFTSFNNKPLAASILRLVFHDCAGPLNVITPENNILINNDIRICDGCIDIDIADHSGLFELAVEPLEEIYQQFASRISRADFWASAANVAVEYTHSLSPKKDILPTMPYYFGRVDGPLSPDAETGSDTVGTEFPLAHLGWDAMFDFFHQFLDLNVEEITAILGGHTLGRAHGDISGFNGQWTSCPHCFDNEFFIAINNVNCHWDQLQNEQQPFPQWVNSNPCTENDDDLMMLTVDLSLRFAFEEPINDTNLDDITGIISCRDEQLINDFNLNGIVDICEFEVSLEFVDKFALNNQAFLNQFVAAWDKILVNNQPETLIKVTPNPFVVPTRFCCIANREPIWNGRCWGHLDEFSCNNNDKCHWDITKCREEQNCKLRLVACDGEHGACCSDYCRLTDNMCR